MVKGIPLVIAWSKSWVSRGSTDLTTGLALPIVYCIVDTSKRRDSPISHWCPLGDELHESPLEELTESNLGCFEAGCASNGDTSSPLALFLEAFDMPPSFAPMLSCNPTYMYNSHRIASVVPYRLSNHFTLVCLKHSSQPLVMSHPMHYLFLLSR